MNKYDFHSKKQSTEDKFNKLKQVMNELGIDDVILYTPEGVMSFGSPERLLATYIHMDKQFNDETMKLILNEINEDKVQEIIEFASHEGHDHVH